MSDEIFDLAVKLIRRGTGYVDLQNELEHAALPGTDILSVINDAEKYVRQMQTQAFDASVEAFQRGESHFEVSKKLIRLGFAPYDADTIAARAEAKARTEMAQQAASEQK